MKKTLWIVVLSLCALTLAGCNCNCDCNDSEEVMNEAMQFCLDHWGTHSIIHSQTAVYGECSFPSGVGCEDDLILEGACNFEPNLDSVDTEEKRLAGCEENVQWWMRDMVWWVENVVTQWWEESEWWASFIRNWVVNYTKDWYNRMMEVECVADFVDGSLSVSYGDEIMTDEVIAEEWDIDDGAIAEEVVMDEEAFDEEVFDEDSLDEWIVDEIVEE